MRINRTNLTHGLGLVVSVALLALSASTASAAVPVFSLRPVAAPTNFTPGDVSGDDFYLVTVTNTGVGATSGPVTVTDTLPVAAGITLAAAGAQGLGTLDEPDGEITCMGTVTVACTDPAPLAAEQSFEIRVPVDVAADASSGAVNVVSVNGGGAARVSVSERTTVSENPAGFGIVPGSFQVAATNEDGSPATQAGSHPYAFTTRFTLNEKRNGLGELVPSGSFKDIFAPLPPGLVGDPNATPTKCTGTQLDTPIRGEFFPPPSCPASSAVGVVELEMFVFGGVRGSLFAAVYNMVPPPGVPAEFGFSPLGQIPVVFQVGVRTGGDYGLTAAFRDISQSLPILASRLVIWGAPGDPSHNAERGPCEGFFGPGTTFQFGVDCTSEGGLTPFLTLPTSCTSSLEASIAMDSWQEQGSLTSEGQPDLSDPRWQRASTQVGGLDGCNVLDFRPSLTLRPDTTAADTPAGVTVEVKVPQETLTAPGGLSAADIQNTTVTLPAGMAINPGQAAGLQACQAGEDGIGSEALPSCPAASQVGTVQIETPLLADKLEGDVYVLQSNPPDLKLLVAASADGVNLKLVGDVNLNENTGQLTTTFKGTPELPFTTFKLAFSGGAQAALTTPLTCGSYQTNVDFTPWSAPLEQDALGSDSFQIASGPGGAPCASPLPFSPAMTAGATTDQAGGFTNFSLLLSRADGQQRVSRLQFDTPKGLSGMISKVPLCDEADANAGTCPAASQIGHTVVEAGPGPYPLVVPQPGQPPAPIYLTGGYKGAPYGLSIVVPLVVGPFTLQTQVVRASIAVDPHTAQLTITTDPLPTIIDGIPTDLRTINAVIDREGFMFNPTNCSPQSFSGTATSTEGVQAPLSSHFQVGSCQSLKFAPKFAVSTSGKTSKAFGASLTAKVSYPAAAQGTQADIARVKVDLPKQLPSRLTTLQKACTNAQFEANPAACPAASKIGFATVTTPILPVPLTGPAIFVSHGGEAFPSLTIVLQGYGVTVDLVGTTFISKKGITSTTFKTVPDVPFNAFTLTLPEGKFSALAANGNLCKVKGGLKMPTEFLGQNGLKINESTKIGVSGCPKARKAKRAKKTKKVGKHARA